MQTNIPDHLPGWEREPATIPIRLVLKAASFKADDSAITVDLSLRGMRVQTNLAVVPGEWVGVVPIGESPHAIPAQVVWVREDESSPWTVVGLEFLGTEILSRSI